MRPYFSTPEAKVYNARCEGVLPLFPDAHFDLIAVDPPYFRVKDEPWDRQWDTAEGFLAWIGSLCQEWRRILKPNGSLYVFASPEMARHVEAEIDRHFHVLNRITWVKEAGWHQKADKEALRSYLSPWEAIIFAEQRGLNAPTPLASCLRTCRETAGLRQTSVDLALGYVRTKDPTKGTEICRRWEEGSSVPSREDFARALAACGWAGMPPADIYDALARPFSASGRDGHTDIWHFPTVPPRPDKHPCEKPLLLMEQIILASTKAGALVLDCFMGTGATGAAAVYNGRRFVGIEAERRYCEQATGRLSQQVLPLPV